MSFEISILVPSRGRPRLLSRLVKSVVSTASAPGRVEILCYIDNDDPALDEYKATKYPHSRVIIGEPVSVSLSWNLLAEECGGDVLVMGNDDVIYRTPGWDKVLEEEAAKFPDDIYCMWFDDKINAANHCAFPMVSRKWYATLGYFTPGVFDFFYNDTWIFDIAKRIGRARLIDSVVAEHMHVGHKKAKCDDTHKRHPEEQLFKDKDLFNMTEKMREASAWRLEQEMNK